ncbi:hypothetical protein BKA66DRAFT_572518 [Pyrenochaeta sp. MPI-SDFR-AT-0127]|nr:hypothetical protein BKA66DRAFT_572518 [Pyrenochaeta sp. MPI-SDFR-AT-0127]
MRFSNLASLLALAASAQAWVIPEGSTDGSYSVTINENGVETHTKLAESDAEILYLNESDLSSDALQRRGRDQVWCGCGFNMNPGNCDAAVADLKNQLSNLIPSGTAFYSIRGDVVAFACNRGSSNWIMNGNAYGEQLVHITNLCGRYIAGSRQAGEDNRALIVGYMRYSNGADFCGASTSSPANHC